MSGRAFKIRPPFPGPSPMGLLTVPLYPVGGRASRLRCAALCLASGPLCRGLLPIPLGIVVNV